MARLPVAVSEFLAQRRIAVAGVSRDGAQPANAIYRKLRAAGHEVFPVNPNACEVEGVTCYRDLRSLPAPVDGVVIATPPAASAGVIRQCHEVGVNRVWLHRSFGDGSVSEEAVRQARELGVGCIVGGCPLMYCAPVDLGHRCMRFVLRLQGRVPG